MGVFIENGLSIEIHYFEGNIHNLMIWLTYEQKPYFLTVEDYHNQLQQMKSKHAVEIESAIHKFLTQSKGEK